MKKTTFNKTQRTLDEEGNVIKENVTIEETESEPVVEEVEEVIEEVTEEKEEEF